MQYEQMYPLTQAAARFGKTLNEHDPEHWAYLIGIMLDRAKDDHPASDLLPMYRQLAQIIATEIRILEHRQAKAQAAEHLPY